MQPCVHIIIVTHNSKQVIGKCIEAIKKQGEGVASITIVDSGSKDTGYLQRIEDQVSTIITLTNVGFSRANNTGYQSLKPGDTDYVLFLNPDAFLKHNSIHIIVSQFSQKTSIGGVTGKLLGYDIENCRPTGSIDSTGVFRKWYGRWYDRGQGKKDTGQYHQSETVPAISGALFCCSVAALQSLGDTVFDKTFFMYKEDIELSLRLRAKGWSLYYCSEALAYHGRGWQVNRSEVSYERKRLSAENEVKLYIRHPSVYIIWAVFKFIVVRIFRL